MRDKLLLAIREGIAIDADRTAESVDWDDES